MIRLAMVGVGPMAALHLQVLRSIGEFDVVSCASRNREHAAEFARVHGIPVDRTIEELRDSPQADAVWVCVSAEAMAPLAIALATLGLPMFLEKPVGLDLAETMAARHAIACPHMVGLNRRFYEVILRGRDLVQEAGGLRAIEVHMPEDLGRVPAKHGSRVRRQWQFANSVHLVDLFRFLGGEPVAVTTENDVRSDTDRSYSALLRMENGVRGVFHARWFAPGGWRLAIYGPEIGVVFQPIERATVLRRGSEPQALEASGWDKSYKPGLSGQARAFLQMVKTGKLPAGTPDLKDYVRSVELLDKLTAP